MDSRHGKMRMNVEGDRLSSLPDDLIHKILSSFKIRAVIAMSVLSSRWRFMWTSFPYLNLSIEDFSALPKFSKFVTNVLFRRNFRADVYSLKLRIRVKASLVFLRRILDYAISNNIQQLNLVCLLEKNIEFPLSIFSFRSLKHLSLTIQDVRSRQYHGNTCFTSAWVLPKLTTLDLESVTLHDDNADKYISVFSKCENLKNLTLKRFSTIGSNGFSIFHPRLSNLTLEDKYCENVVNVIAPQLKNLTIRSCYGKHVISAPELSSLFYNGYGPLHLSTEGFISLEKADICVSNPQDAHAHQIACLLQQLHNVKFLKLNLEIVEEIQAKKLMAELRLLLKREKDNSKTNKKPHELKKLKFGENMVSCWEDLVVQIQQRKEKACLFISKLQEIEQLLTKLPASNRAKIQPSFFSLCGEVHIAFIKITDGMKIQCDENRNRLSFYLENEFSTTLKW